MVDQLPTEAWNAIFGIAMAATAGMLELIRRAVNSNKADSRGRQEEIKELVKPVSNGFAEEVRDLLGDVVATVHNMKAQVDDLSGDLAHVKGSQIDLHRRMDQHLEDHVPKQRRRGFFR